MTIPEIQRLFAYNAWANNRFFEALSTVPAAKCQYDLKTSHHSLHGTMVHLVAAEKIWLSRLVQKPDAALMTPKESPALDSLKPIWEDVASRTASFISKLKNGNLQKDVVYTTTEGKKHSNSYQQILQHIVNHSSYHRGQLAAMMRQLGLEPACTDLILFFRHTALPRS